MRLLVFSSRILTTKSRLRAETLAETRVSARWPPQNIVKRVALSPNPSQNAGFGALASAKHRKTRGFDGFACIYWCKSTSTRARTRVLARFFMRETVFASRILTRKSRLRGETLAKTRVSARWPPENIVKRVVSSDLRAFNGAKALVHVPERRFWLGF